MKKEIPQEVIDKILASATITTKVQTVYACILKDGKLEIEDNREQIQAEIDAERMKNRKTPKPGKSGSGNETAITNDKQS